MKKSPHLPFPVPTQTTKGTSNEVFVVLSWVVLEVDLGIVDSWVVLLKKCEL